MIPRCILARKCVVCLLLSIINVQNQICRNVCHSRNRECGMHGHKHERWLWHDHQHQTHSHTQILFWKDYVKWINNVKRHTKCGSLLCVKMYYDYFNPTFYICYVWHSTVRSRRTREGRNGMNYHFRNNDVRVSEMMSNRGQESVYQNIWFNNKCTSRIHTPIAPEQNGMVEMPINNMRYSRINWGTGTIFVYN